MASLLTSQVRGVHSKDTENSIVKLDHQMISYQQKRYVLMKFFHRENYIVFSYVGNRRRKIKIYDEVQVLIGIVA